MCVWVCIKILSLQVKKKYDIDVEKLIGVVKEKGLPLLTPHDVVQMNIGSWLLLPYQTGASHLIIMFWLYIDVGTTKKMMCANPLVSHICCMFENLVSTTIIVLKISNCIKKVKLSWSQERV